MGGAARQTPDQKAVDGAKQQLPARGAIAGLWVLIQNPAGLGAGKIGIQQQAGLVADHILMATTAQSLADLNRAAILPDDGPVEWRTCRLVPNRCGFALVGNADACQIRSRNPRFRQNLSTGCDNRVPDLIQVMFNPTRLGEILGKLLLRCAHGLHVAVKQHRPC